VALPAVLKVVVTKSLYGMHILRSGECHSRRSKPSGRLASHFDWYLALTSALHGARGASFPQDPPFRCLILLITPRAPLNYIRAATRITMARAVVIPKTTSQPARSDLPSSLTTLPPEVRNSIYEVLFRRKTPVLVPNTDVHLPQHSKWQPLGSDWYQSH
jgi:hypothetical protein